MTLTPESRTVREIMARCILSPEGCWIWTGGTSRGGGKRNQSNPGYPTVWEYETKRSRRGHAVMYEAFHGPLPPGRERAHTCSNSLCLNPRDMEAQTPEENRRERIERDRARKIEQTGGEPR
jgi:hypothetical protein